MRILPVRDRPILVLKRAKDVEVHEKMLVFLQTRPRAQNQTQQARSARVRVAKNGACSLQHCKIVQGVDVPKVWDLVGQGENAESSRVMGCRCVRCRTLFRRGPRAAVLSNFGTILFFLGWSIGLGVIVITWPGVLRSAKGGVRRVPARHACTRASATSA